ncbi:hypothetical protein KI387_023078, partial [Taxus chinensis]
MGQSGQKGANRPNQTEKGPVTVSPNQSGTSGPKRCPNWPNPTKKSPVRVQNQ